MESRDGWRKEATLFQDHQPLDRDIGGHMSSNKTLENLVKQSDLSTKQPLELWKQLHRSKHDYRPSAAALARRASLDLGMCAPSQ